MSSLVVYDTISGYLSKSASGGYAGVHDAASGTAGQDDQYPYIKNEFSGGTSYAIARGVAGFNLSALPSGAVITAAVISLYGVSLSSDEAFNIVVVSGADLVNPLVAGDYGDLLNDITSFGSITSAAWVNSAFNNITLNATGRNAIVKGAMNFFGFRCSLDINNTTPVGYNDASWLGHGYGNDAYITITYSSGEGAGIIAIVETRFHYIDAYGVERFIEGTVVV